MRNRLLVFNCSTDMALASGLDNYTPPPMIQCMERELELLPIWWAFNGDVVLVTDIDEAKLFLDQVNEKLTSCELPPKNIVFMDRKGRLSGKSIDRKQLQPCPWGWNKSLVRQLLRLGLNPEAMPTPERLDELRMFSNRRSGVAYIRHLLSHFQSRKWPDNDAVSFHELVGFDMDFVDNWPAMTDKMNLLLPKYPMMLKSPWSSSGKGNLVMREADKNAIQWAKSVIDKQGGLCVDRFYRKELDFAMEFSVHDGVCAFLGYSLFRTDTNGRYEGNVVGSQHQILKTILDAGVEMPILKRVADYHQHCLPLWLGHDYDDVVGIDMLLANVGGRHYLHPCVEINLRMNMGIVALALAQQRIPDMSLTPSDHPHFRARLFQGRFFIEK